MALVSIITPAYNCRNTIKETYDSVLSQTFKDREWIIADDRSKDDSFSFIKELAKNESRVVVLQTPKNGGELVSGGINPRGKIILNKKHKAEGEIDFNFRFNSEECHIQVAHTITSANYDREIGKLLLSSNDVIKIVVCCLRLPI